MDQSKVEAMLDWQAPITVSEIQSFLGLAGYYKKFIKNFSRIATPLTCLMKKGVQFTLDAQCQKAFDCLKQRLTTVSVL